nr:hypothetical protein [Deltaproteobacteria bacterium]
MRTAIGRSNIQELSETADDRVSARAEPGRSTLTQQLAHDEAHDEAAAEPGRPAMF